MGLKAIITSLDGLDGSIKGLYKEVDGKFILDVAGIDDHPKIAGLKKTMIEERDARREFEKQVRNYKTKVGDLDLDKLRDIDPDSYAQMVSDLEKFKEEQKKREQKKLKDKENWEKLEQQLRDETEVKLQELKDRQAGKIKIYQDKLEEVGSAKQKELDAMHTSLEKVLKDREIVAALARHKGNIPLLTPHVNTQVQIKKTDSGDYAAVVVDDENQIRINDAGKPMTIDDLVVEMKEKPEFQGTGVFEKETTDGGSGSGGNKDESGDDTKNPFSEKHWNLTKQAQLKKSNPAEYERLEKAAGKG